MTESQTKFATKWLYGVLAISVVNIIINYLMADFALSASDLSVGEDATSQQLASLLSIQSYVAIPYLIMVVGSVFVVARWIYKAANSNQEAGIEGLKYSPAWSVGWFFIPVMNLFKPYFALKEHYFARLKTDEWPSKNAMTTFHLWWASWIATNVLSNRSLRASMNDDVNLHTLVSVSFTDIGADIAQILSCLALIKIMKQFTQGHE